MADADFTVSLKDEMTKNALKAQASIKSLEAQLHSLNKAAAVAKGGDALKRFNIGSQMKTARAQANIAKTAQVKAAREAKRISDFRQTSADSGVGSSLGALIPGGTAGAAVAGVAAITAAAALAVAAVVKLGVAFSEASIQAAVFGQRSVQALDLLIGSAGTAVVQFNDLRLEAAGLGLDVIDTQKSFQKLLAAQFEIGKAREFIRMGADLQAIGATSEEVSGALLAITQIKSKGRLQAQEMLQLQERGISAELVYGELTKTLGKTREELAKMQEAGEIKAPEALEAILGAVRKKTGVENTGDAGKAFADNTLAGMKGKFDAGLQNLFIDIGKLIEPTLVPLAQKVIDLFESIVNDPGVQNFGRQLLLELEYFQAWVSENWPMIKEVIVGGVNDVLTVFRLAGDATKVVIDHWKQLRVIFYAVGIVIGLLAVGVLALLAPLYAAIYVITELISAIADAVVWIGENFTYAITVVKDIILNAFSDAGTWLLDAGKAIVQGLIDGIMAMVPNLNASSEEMAEATKGPFTAEMLIMSPSKLFEEYGIFTAQGYIQGIQSNDNAVSSATADMAGRAMMGMGSVTDDAAAEGGAAAAGMGRSISVHVENINAGTEEGGRAAARGLYDELVMLLEDSEAA